MKELLFVVDMVNGFVKEGNMHDKKIMGIVDTIKEECDYRFSTGTKGKISCMNKCRLWHKNCLSDHKCCGLMSHCICGIV